jgi:hypothetical protein
MQRPRGAPVPRSRRGSREAEAQETSAPIPIGALEQHVAIVGRTGSGKSYAARGAVEQLLEEGRQVVVLDPSGVWWGLRATSDGGPGFPVPVIGGDRADVPLPADAGETLAALLVARRQSAVIDTGAFTMGERRRFYRAFLARLHHENRAALHLVVDEADELAPQRPLPDQTTVLHEMDRIVRRGRARGFRVLMITQRPAVLHKDVLSQAGCLIAMQLTASQDRAAIGAWIEGQADRAEAKALLASLPQLRTGEGWVWWPHAGPPVQQRFPLIRTLDTGSTPAHGEETTDAELSDAGLDLEALRLALSTAPASKFSRDDSKALAALRAERDRLQRERDEAIAQLEAYRAAVMAAASLLTPLADEPSGVAELGAQEALSGAPPPQPEQPATKRSSKAQRSTQRGRGEGAEMRILRVLVAHGRPATMRQWATLAGLSAKGGTWSTYVSRLRTNGYIEEAVDGIGPSAAGRAAAGEVGPPPSSEETVSRWCEAVGVGAAGRMLKALADRYPRAASRTELAEELGLAATGGTFSTYLSRLVSNGLAARLPDGSVRASDVLFPGAGSGKA